jgi:hypothetical protein
MYCIIMKERNVSQCYPFLLSNGNVGLSPLLINWFFINFICAYIFCIFTLPSLFFNKGAKNMHWRKVNLFNKWWCDTWIFSILRNETRSLPLLMYRNQFKTDPESK